MKKGEPFAATFVCPRCVATQAAMMQKEMEAATLRNIRENSPAGESTPSKPAVTPHLIRPCVTLCDRIYRGISRYLEDGEESELAFGPGIMVRGVACREGVGIA
jgi:hypothetical protein